jgi:ribonuclease HI
MAQAELVIHADGACRGNPGPGGWGVLLSWNGTHKELSGSEPATTNNRMELTAAIMGLSALKRPTMVSVRTDSQYVIKGITEWLPAWKARGWRTADRKPVKNQDLWERLDQAAGAHTVRWIWVKGHSGDPGNERVDELANLAIDAMLAGTQRSQAV